MSKKTQKPTKKVDKPKEEKPSLAQEVAEEIALKRIRGEKVDTFPEVLLDI